MDKELLKGALHTMLCSRFFEEKTEKLFAQSLIHGTTHLANGQEASQAGLCMALDDNDWIVPTHRCHGFTVCRGSDPYAMFSEMAGSSHGLAKGLGGSMHMPDRIHCNLGSSAVVGSGVSLATGIAFYMKHNGVKNISVAIFGDGASSRGNVHECMNLASVFSLPVLFYCENNLYGMSAPSSKMVSIGSISQRSESYSFPGMTVDGNNVESVYDAVKEARKEIIESGKPYLLEVLTYRQKGHSKSDKRLYRTAEEEQMWLNKDPITLLENKIISLNIMTRQEIDRERQLCSAFIDDCAKRAYKDSNDRLTKDQAMELVYG